MGRMKMYLGVQTACRPTILIQPLNLRVGIYTCCLLLNDHNYSFKSFRYNLYHLTYFYKEDEDFDGKMWIFLWHFQGSSSCYWWEWLFASRQYPPTIPFLLSSYGQCLLNPDSFSTTSTFNRKSSVLNTSKMQRVGSVLSTTR